MVIKLLCIHFVLFYWKSSKNPNNPSCFVSCQNIFIAYLQDRKLYKLCLASHTVPSFWNKLDTKAQLMSGTCTHLRTTCSQFYCVPFTKGFLPQPCAPIAWWVGLGCYWCGGRRCQCTPCWVPPTFHLVALCPDAGKRRDQPSGAEEVTPQREGELGGAQQGVPCHSTSSTGQYGTACAPPTPSHTFHANGNHSFSPCSEWKKTQTHTFSVVLICRQAWHLYANFLYESSNVVLMLLTCVKVNWYTLRMCIGT